MTPLSNEEVDLVRASVPWIKILGSGSLFTLVVSLWKVFGLYSRLKKVEEKVENLELSKPITEDRHNEITAHCRESVDAKIAKATSDLHLMLLKEVQEVRADVSDIKETQASVLGELKHISNTLKTS